MGHFGFEVYFRFCLTPPSFVENSMKRCRFGDEYTYHALLNVEEHFFGQSPTREQDVAKAVFGFGKTDNNIISEAIEFPLFVCYEPGKRSKHFRYLGNYVALKLDPVAREWMSEGVCFFLLSRVVTYI